MTIAVDLDVNQYNKHTKKPATQCGVSSGSAIFAVFAMLSTFLVTMGNVNSFHFVNGRLQPLDVFSRRRHHSIKTHIKLGIRIAFSHTFCMRIIMKRPEQLNWD